MSPNPAQPQKQRTLGEELFTVHLQRQKPEDSILDRDTDGIDDTQRKRARSIGDELWEVHVRRCEGADPDYDTPKEQQEEKPKALKSKKKPVASPAAAHVIHLRNRDVPPPTNVH